MNNAGIPPEVEAALKIAAVVGSLVVYYGVQILFLMTLSKCLRRCAVHNRRMEPGDVYLALIPCYNLYWNFQIAQRMDESLRREFRDRGFERREDYTGKVGYNWALMVVLGLVPCVNYISWILVLCFFVAFWVKVAGFSKELDEAPNLREEREGYDDDLDGYDDRHDDYDDRPPDEERPWRRR